MDTILWLIILLSLISLPLLVASLRHAYDMPVESSGRPWKRCVICGVYNRTFTPYCVNHDHLTPILTISDRQKKRAYYHENASECWQLTPEQAEGLVAYALKLEELTEEEWTTGAVCEVRAAIWESELPQFVAFMKGIEEATGQRFKICNVIEQYLVREVYEDDKTKIAQN